MPLKPIIDIAVDDTKFKEFLQLFEKYQASVKNLPQGWQEVGDAVQKSGATYGEMAAIIGSQAEIIHRITAEQEEMERSAGRVARAFSGVSGAAQTTLGHVAEITRHLLKWGEMGGLLGLAGAGGSLFGLDRLGERASSLRTAGLSLGGVNPAAVQALNVNLGQFANPTAGLQNIVNLQQSLQGQVAFNSLGISSDFSASPERAYIDAIREIRKAYQTTPAGQRQNAPWWQFATQILSPEEIRAFGSMGDQEFSQRVNSAQRDQQRFAYRPGELRAWQDFDIQLSRAGNSLSHDFLGALEKLTGPLSSLSDAAVKLVGDFLNSQLLKDAIDQLTQGIGWLDQKLNDGSLQKGFEAFGADLDIIVKGLGGFASFITGHPILFGLGDLNSQPPAATIGPDGKTLIVPNGPMGVPGAGYQPWNPFSWSWSHNPIMPGAHAAPVPGFGGAAHAAPTTSFASGGAVDLISQAVRDAGGNDMAVAGLLSNFDYESGGLNPNAEESPGGALGWAQWIGSRRRGLEAYAAAHGLSPTDPRAQAGFLRQELQGQYAGVISKMNAANSPTDAALIGLTDFEGINPGNTAAASRGHADWNKMVSTHVAKAQGYYDALHKTGARLPSLPASYVFGTNAPPAGAGVVGSGFDFSGRESQKDLDRVNHQQWVAGAKRFFDHFHGAAANKPFSPNQQGAATPAGGAQQIKVTVDNNTGGSAIVSAAQMPIAI